MAHPFLARKWRHKKFLTTEGVAHVLRALASPFVKQRMHHALAGNCEDSFGLKQRLYL